MTGSPVSPVIVTEIVTIKVLLSVLTEENAPLKVRIIGDGVLALEGRLLIHT